MRSIYLQCNGHLQVNMGYLYYSFIHLLEHQETCGTGCLYKMDVLSSGKHKTPTPSSGVTWYVFIHKWRNRLLHINLHNVS